MIRYFTILCGVLLTQFLAIQSLFEFNFILLLVYLLVSFQEESIGSLDKVWVVSFIYIIVAEGIFHLSHGKVLEREILLASRYLLTTNWILLFFYSRFNNRAYKIAENQITKTTSLTIVLLVLLELIFIVTNYQDAIAIFTQGRVSAASQIVLNVFITGFIKSSSLILPAAFVYFFKEKYKDSWFWVSLVFSAPIFIILFMLGTRFYLLFSLTAFVITGYYRDKVSFKGKAALVIGLVIMVILSNFMKSIRTFGVENESSLNINQNKELVEFGSNEAIILSTAKMIKLFQKRDHMYGASTGFITYFWIPRTWWPEKPQMLGYWLVRAYGDRGFSGGYSASFGYPGDAYADFGYLGGIFFSALLGILLAYFNGRIKSIYGATSTPLILIASLSFSYVFFFVRSPQTSTFNFIGLMIVYKLITLTLKSYTARETIIPHQYTGTLSKSEV